MVNKLLVAGALCAALAGPVARVTETTLPLADEKARAFYFIGDLALAVEYDGGGKVTGRINAYDLSTPAFIWRQEVRVQDTDKNPGPWIMSQAARHRLLMGNGPLTALDLQTGRTLWSLDCKTAGSVDLGRSSFYTDGDFLLRGTEDCGDLNKQRVLRIDGATGAVRWQADAEVHAYKTGNILHRDFAVIEEGKPDVAELLADSGATDELLDMLLTDASLPPTQVLIAGERLSGVDYRTGRVNFAVKDKPGRWVPMATNGLSLWVDDEKLVAYSTRDGSRQWAFDMDAPWPILLPLDTTPTSDFLAVTWRNAHRIDRAGRAKWTLKREDETWGQLITPSTFMLTLKKRTYAAVDLATGRIRWRTEIDSDRDGRKMDEELSVARTGIVLVAGYDSRSGPWELTALDAATGKIVWTVTRVNKRKLERYWVIDGTRLVVRDADDVLTELDVKTGAPIGAFGQNLPRRYDRNDRRLNGYRVGYNSDKKTLTCDGPNGTPVWQRKGELSENAKFAILAQGVVVWPTQDGKVELIDLASGATLHTTMSNRKPFVGVDVSRGRVLVPAGNSIKVLAVGGAP